MSYILLQISNAMVSYFSVRFNRLGADPPPFQNSYFLTLHYKNYRNMPQTPPPGKIFWIVACYTPYHIHVELIALARIQKFFRGNSRYNFTCSGMERGKSKALFSVILLCKLNKFKFSMTPYRYAHITTG